MTMMMKPAMRGVALVVASALALAVDHLPPVTADTMPALVGFLAGANALATARLEARYGR